MNHSFLLPVYVSTLVAMYFVSGIDKLFHFEKVVYGLHKRLAIAPMFLCSLMIVAAIFIELLAPLACLYGSVRYDDIRAVRMGIWGSNALVLFTVMATLFYHFPPTTSAKYYPFMSNLATTGGLLLMRYIFTTQS